jgi:hypothetical protein
MDFKITTRTPELSRILLWMKENISGDWETIETIGEPFSLHPYKKSYWMDGLDEIIRRWADDAYLASCDVTVCFSFKDRADALMFKMVWQ